MGYPLTRLAGRSSYRENWPERSENWSLFGCHCWLVQQCCAPSTISTAGQASSGTLRTPLTRLATKRHPLPRPCCAWCPERGVHPATELKPKSLVPRQRRPTCDRPARDPSPVARPDRL
jgi:hypothetical protein